MIYVYGYQLLYNLETDIRVFLYMICLQGACDKVDSCSQWHSVIDSDTTADMNSVCVFKLDLCKYLERTDECPRTDQAILISIQRLYAVW